jgi:hypothetical protein
MQLRRVAQLAAVAAALGGVTAIAAAAGPGRIARREVARRLADPAYRSKLGRFRAGYRRLSFEQTTRSGATVTRSYRIWSLGRNRGRFATRDWTDTVGQDGTVQVNVQNLWRATVRPPEADTGVLRVHLVWSVKPEHRVFRKEWTAGYDPETGLTQVQHRSGTNVLWLHPELSGGDLARDLQRAIAVAERNAWRLTPPLELPRP